MPSETPFLPAGTAARRSYCKFAQKNSKDLLHFGTVDWRSAGLDLSKEFQKSQRVPQGTQRQSKPQIIHFHPSERSKSSPNALNAQKTTQHVRLLSVRVGH